MLNKNTSEFRKEQSVKVGDSNSQSNEELQREVDTLRGKLKMFEQHDQNATERKLFVGKKITNFFIGKNLKESLNKLYNELPNKVTKDTLADVTANVIWRFTRIGLFAILAAFIPYILLYQQNTKISEQNNLFLKQNKKIEIQTHLLEADRRSALIFLMSNIMDKVDSELKEDWGNDDIRNLSPELMGRIAALSFSFKPYRFLQGDSLINYPFSPERAHLLLALTKSGIKWEYNFLNDNPLNFEYAYLKGADLIDADLQGLNLSEVDLSYANLSGADLSEANLSGANLSNADLSYANLSRVSLGFADLNGVDLTCADLTETYLSNADLSYSIMSCANLTFTNLEHCDLRFIEFKGMPIGTDMWAKINNPFFDGAIIENENWFQGLPDSIDGIKKLKEEYEIRYDKDGKVRLHYKNDFWR